MSRLLFVLNDAAFFLSHRLPVALAAQAAGFEVHVATPETAETASVRAQGLVYHPVPLTRNGTIFFAEITGFFALLRLFRQVKPDVLHLVTIKPMLYGGIAARLASVPAVVAAISGLGFVFSNKGFKAGLLRSLVRWLYRTALAHPKLRVIFQNRDNAESISRLGALKPEQVCLIHGAGVNLSEYALTPLPPEKETPLVILPARLLISKGVPMFVEAARQLLARGVKARFALVGAPDPGNPESVTEKALADWVDERIVECWGHRDDMSAVLAQSSLVVLPSYAEGLPKALIEAQACGRAVVTTDAPGCRDAIIPNVTGLLVPVRDAAALADAMAQLLNDRERLQAMGKAGRAWAEKRFDVRHVVARHLQIYQSLM
jgi:glycosyltransferase involved in cell wall biosynthesis